MDEELHEDENISLNSHLSNKRGKYAYVTNSERYKLLLYIEILELPVTEACTRLSMKYTTAKSILALFNKSGRIHRKQRSRFEQEYFRRIETDRQLLKAQQEHMLKKIKEEHYKKLLRAQPLTDASSSESQSEDSAVVFEIAPK